jgi:hypothetical protein
VYHPDYCETAVPTLLDRGQAHLLMLYLQEHLKEDEQKLICPKCDRYHKSGYDCRILGQPK